MIDRNVSLIMPKPYAKDHDQYLKNYLDTGIKKMIGTGRELKVIKKDGSELDVFLSIGEYLIEGQNFFTGIMTDISQLKKREAELAYHKQNLQKLVEERTHDLILAKNKAETANEAKSTFLANISHEIRTPMHGVLSFTEIGLDKVHEADRSVLEDCFREISETDLPLKKRTLF